MEATEEELSLIGTVLADAAIMQEKSEYNLSVAAYMASGMTEEQAREQANWDLIAEAGETAIVSGIAGSIGGFGASSAAAFKLDGLDTEQQGAQQAQAAQNQQDVNADGQQEAAVQEAQEKPQTPQEQERAALEATGYERVPQSEDYVGLVTQKGVTEHDSAPTVDTPKASAQDGQDENATAAPENGQESPKAEQGKRAEQGGQSEQLAQSDSSTVGTQNTPSGEVKKSKTFTNTGLHNTDEDIRRGYLDTLRNDPTAGDYEVKRNADTHATAQDRTLFGSRPLYRSS